MSRKINKQNCKWDGEVDGWKWSNWLRTRHWRDQDKWSLIANKNRRGLGTRLVSNVNILPKDKFDGRESHSHESI